MVFKPHKNTAIPKLKYIYDRVLYGIPHVDIVQRMPNDGPAVRKLSINTRDIICNNVRIDVIGVRKISIAAVCKVARKSLTKEEVRSNRGIEQHIIIEVNKLFA